jgi:hypothetical protein
MATAFHCKTMSLDKRQRCSSGSSEGWNPRRCGARVPWLILRTGFADDRERLTMSHSSHEKKACGSVILSLAPRAPPDSSDSQVPAARTHAIFRQNREKKGLLQSRLWRSQTVEHQPYSAQDAANNAWLDQQLVLEIRVGERESQQIFPVSTFFAITCIAKAAHRDEERQRRYPFTVIFGLAWPSGTPVGNVPVATTRPRMSGARKKQIIPVQISLMSFGTRGNCAVVASQRSRRLHRVPA